MSTMSTGLHPRLGAPRSPLLLRASLATRGHRRAAALAPPPRPRRTLRRAAAASAEGAGDSAATGPPPRPGAPPPPPPWLAHLVARAKAAGAGAARLGLNVAGFLLLAQLLPGLAPGARRLPPSFRPDSLLYEVPYSTFVAQARARDVARVAVDGETFTWSLRPRGGAAFLRAARTPAGLDPARVALQATRPADCPAPYEDLLRAGTPFAAAGRRGGWANALVLAIFVFAVAAAVQRAGPGAAARRAAALAKLKGGAGGGDRPAVTFADVAGVDEAKEELEEVVSFLKAPERFARLGARPPAGVLLVGPPGTGKTLLARAAAGEAGVPFFSAAASEFVELYVGQGALRVRELFAAARKAAPCIVFIDEIDAVGGRRGGGGRASAGSDEREQTLNQLLAELDGFDSHGAGAPVIVLAATNRADTLDPALLRPGRFDRRVAVEPPDRTGREEILRVHIAARALPLAGDVAVPAVAAATAGFSGAELANVVNEAAMLAARAGRDAVTAADFEDAALRAVAGVEKKRSPLSAAERTAVAKHEVGHALAAAAVAALLPLGAAPRVERLSIVPRSGGALGFTYMPQVEDRSMLLDTELRGQLAVLMGGRAAEELTCAAVSTGAADDLSRATSLAARAVSEFGLAESVGPLSVGALGGDEVAALLGGGGGAGGKVGADVQREVRLLCGGALAAARAVVAANRGLHAELSETLEREERLGGEALAAALARVEAPPELRRFVLRDAA
jgi:cell division protease FtsH